MTRYTAKNGTTFHYVPESEHCLYISGADDDGTSVRVDLDDVREFIEHLSEGDPDAPQEADAAAVSTD